MISTLRAVFFVFVGAQCVPYAVPQDPPTTTKAAPSAVVLALLEKPVASGLGILFPALPKDQFELSTCETVLVGETDLGVFAVTPSDKDWKHDDGSWSYTWKLKSELELQFRATPSRDAVAFEYKLKNAGKETLDRVQLHPCLPTTGAPSFFPGTEEQARRGPGARAARASMKDWSELWSRLFLWREGKPFSFASGSLAKSEVHMAFAASGSTPTEWNWWKNASERFDGPWIALRSKDGKHVLGLAFERSSWASSNVGDARSCLHLFPWFGKIAPGETKVVRGELILIDGGLEEAHARLAKDFPLAHAK